MRHAEQFERLAFGIGRDQFGVGDVDGIWDRIGQASDPQLGVELIGDHRLKPGAYQMTQDQGRDEISQYQPGRHAKPDPRESLFEAKPTHVPLHWICALQRKKGCRR